jgi:hypothetical protein
LGLLFDIFDVRVSDDDSSDPDGEWNDSYDKIGSFEKLVQKTQKLQDEESGLFSLDQSFIALEAKYKMKSVYNESLNEQGMVYFDQ